MTYETDVPEAVGIAESDKPPFVRPPEPETMFGDRAARFHALAPGHQLEAYLSFLAALAQVQAEVAGALPPPHLSSAADMRMRATNGMPVLPREELAEDTGAELALDLLVEAARGIAMPAEAAAALERLAAADPEERTRMRAAVLSDAIPVDAAAEHVFVAAALQVTAALRAASVPPSLPQPVADGVCPSCGGPPVASTVVAWAAQGGSRYVHCALCGTCWNHVRVKCVACGSTEGIGYEAIEGVADTIKAETCDGCRSYLKILYQTRDPSLEPVADDVASLGLDILVREAGWGRAGVNPFLLGY
jgi:FdhE protein